MSQLKGNHQAQLGEHIPVLLREAVAALQVKAGSWYVDATFGRGGHTSHILYAGANVIAFDVDQEAVTFGEKEFAIEIAQGRLILKRSNFDQMEDMIAEAAARQTSKEGKKSLKIDGVLFDFGVSSPQLASQTRGFSFQYDAELDMRMDDRLGVKAKDLLALLGEKQLADVFFEYGGEQHSRQIAKAIIAQRKKKPIQTVGELVELIEKLQHGPRGHLHPATKVFQALRIAVNTELDSIEKALPQALNVLEAGGRIVAISFHEGEDRIVKTWFKDWEKQGKGMLIAKKAETPSENEIEQNARSRSAKLRIFEKK